MAVAVGVLVGVGLAVLVAVGVRVLVAVWVAVLVAVGVRVGVALDVAVGVLVGVLAQQEQTAANSGNYIRPGGLESRREMKIGRIPCNVGVANVEMMIQMATTAEEIGLESIWTGSKKNAFRRVARYGQGWFAPAASVDQLAALLPGLDEACAADSLRRAAGVRGEESAVEDPVLGGG